MKISTVVIGASAGGVTAVQRLFRALDSSFEIPFVVVQHLPPDAAFSTPLVFGMNPHIKFEEAVDKTPIEPSHAYFAPPAYHLLIERDRSLALSQDAPVHHARPSIDVTFESAAEAIGSSVCGILLTGANSDGAAGLKRIADVGGYTIVQSLEDAEVSTMPGSALRLFKPSFVGSIEEIAQKLLELKLGGAR